MRSAARAGEAVVLKQRVYRVCRAVLSSHFRNSQGSRTKGSRHDRPFTICSQAPARRSSCPSSVTTEIHDSLGFDGISDAVVGTTTIARK